MRSLSGVRACLRPCDIWPYLPGSTAEESVWNCQPTAMQRQSGDDLSTNRVAPHRS